MESHGIPLKVNTTLGFPSISWSVVPFDNRLYTADSWSLDFDGVWAAAAAMRSAEQNKASERYLFQQVAAELSPLYTDTTLGQFDILTDEFIIDKPSPSWNENLAGWTPGPDRMPS